MLSAYFLFLIFFYSVHCIHIYIYHHSHTDIHNHIWTNVTYIYIHIYVFYQLLILIAFRFIYFWLLCCCNTIFIRLPIACLKWHTCGLVIACSAIKKFACTYLPTCLSLTLSAVKCTPTWVNSFTCWFENYMHGDKYTNK